MNFSNTGADGKVRELANPALKNIVHADLCEDEEGEPEITSEAANRREAEGQS